MPCGMLETNEDMGMGRQVGFYMTLSDERSFIKTLQAQADVVVALHYFTTPEPTLLDMLPPVGTFAEHDADLVIYNGNVDPKLRTYSLSGGRYALDLTRSEVIQFNRCIMSPDSELEPGRLWYDHETMQCKPKR